MKLTALAACLSTAVAAVPALAETIDVTYTATVSDALGTSSNTGYADGATITGGFVIDSVTDAVTGSYLGTYVAPPSSANFINASNPAASLSSTDAIYKQGLSASAGDAFNNSITVDFSALSGFTGSDPAAFLLQTPATLAAQIDFTGAASSFPSTVTYYQGDAQGNNVTQVDAYLDGVSVSAVPLPAAAWLMLSSIGGLFAFARRRHIG